MKLDHQDLRWAIQRLPKNLRTVVQTPEWSEAVFIGGGYLRSIVSGEKVNDVDVFVKSQKEAEHLAYKICFDKKDVIKTDNAYTVKGKTTVQIIHHWIFEKPEDVSNSFDFTVCCAVIFCTTKKVEGTAAKYESSWDSFCDDRFYIDLASKRLTYRSQIRNEDVGGSMLRVLKYYQKGYRIPLNSLGIVIARLMSRVRQGAIDMTKEEEVAKVITGLLREVDPNIDPLHIAHLPSSENIEI